MNLTSFSHFWGWNISEDQTLLPSLVVLFLVRGPSGYKNPKGTASVIFLLFTNNTLQKKGSIEREKCIYHLLQEGASEAANKTPESTRDSHCTHQAGSSVRIHTLKMPIAGLKMTRTTWLFLNQYKHQSGKTKSIKQTVRCKAWGLFSWCWQIKE